MTKWCRFRHDGRDSFGKIDDDQVSEVTGAPWGEFSRTGRSFPLSSVKLLVPVVPPTFFCVGVNYRDHVIKMAELRGTKPAFPPRPDIGYRANSALCAHGDEILKPADAGEEFQYEGELVAVFGKRAKNVSRDEALDCVFGWTIGNDVSERAWQKSDRTLWRAKNSDTFKPMGPWIVTGGNLDEMVTSISVNGKKEYDFKTNNMIFGIVDYIIEVTKYVTIQPGDVMWMGTDGVPGNVRGGDRVDISIIGIGTLSNTVRQL
jgi:2-keto-4-pentenoate hydratase/2-oxohepta-3-ene-1,7-dioic acid hydratase in catechol pathway